MKIIIKNIALQLLFVASCSFVACNFSTNEGSKGPIVLGDTQTIVTETDSNYLEDMVLDKPVEEKPELKSDEDSFNNVANAKKLADQQKADSLLAIKNNAEKKSEAPAPKKEIKKETTKKNDKIAAQKSSKNSKEESNKKKKRR